MTRYYRLDYVFLLRHEKKEIATGEPNNKAAVIATRPCRSRSWAIEWPLDDEKFLAGNNRPNDYKRIIA